MKRYYDVDTAPLTFHNFFHYISLPLGFLSALGELMQVSYTRDPWTDVAQSFNFINLFLLAFCFFTLRKWTPNGWYLIISELALRVLYAFVVIFLYMVYDPVRIATASGFCLSTFISATLIGIYYYKRKPLFFPGIMLPPDPAGEDPLDGEAADPSPLETNTPPVLFCRKCGSKLLPESAFCSKCGTQVIKRWET